MYNTIMKTEAYTIKSSFLQLKTDLPLFTESYHFNEYSNGAFHLHEFFEIGISLDGEATHRSNDGTHLLHRGHVYFIPIGQSHSITVPISWHVQNIYFLPRLIYHNLSRTNFPNPLFNRFLLNFLDMHFNSTIHIVLSPTQIDILESLLTAYNNIHMENKQLLDDYRSNCMLNILMILCNAYYELYLDKADATDSRIPTLLTAISEHIDYATSDLIKLLATQLQLHPQYINKLVKSTFNTTLANLIIETKVEKSCEYLLSDHSITETAHLLNFFDHSHYNKFFVKYLGISPSEYKVKYLAR